MFQTKEQDETPETDLNETDVNDISDKEIKITVINMLTEVKRTVHEQSENFSKEMENIRKCQTDITIELKGAIK